MKEPSPERNTGATRREFMKKTMAAAAGMALPVGAFSQELTLESPELDFGDRVPLLKLAEKLPPVPESSKEALINFLEKHPAGLKLHIYIPGNPKEEYNQSFLIKNPESVRKISAPFLTNYRLQIVADREVECYIQETPFMAEWKPQKFEVHKDTYGNSICTVEDIIRRPRDEFSEDVRVQELVIVVFPIPIAKKKSDVGTFVPLNFELPWTGGKVEGFLYAQMEVPKFTIEGYHVFGNTYNELGSDADFITKFEKPVRQAIVGIEALNHMLGGHQKFMHNISVISTRWGKEDRDVKNANVEWATPNMVNFFDDQLTDGDRIEMVGFHEAVHGMDFQLGVTEHIRFQELFQSLPEDFFLKLNESPFLIKGRQKAGHSQDNKFELLATLINSLNLTKWQKKGKQLGRDFLKNYSRSLATLEQVLRECGGQAVPPDAPIFGIISERIRFIKDFFNKQEETLTV